MKLFTFLFFFISFNVAADFTVKNSELDQSGGHLLTYNHERPPEIELPPGSQLKSCTFAGKKCSGNPIILKLSGKVPQNHKATALHVRYTTEGKNQEIKLTLLPGSFPSLNQEGESKIKKPLIFSVSAPKATLKLTPCHLFIVSPEGGLDFYRSLPFECHDFRPHRIGDKTYYSYLQAEESFIFVGYLGPRVILDSDFKEVKRIPFLTDFHDFILLSLDHWVDFEAELDRLGNGKVYINKRLREWKDGKLILDWGVSDIVKQFGSEIATDTLQTVFRGEIVIEIFHLNSIQKIGDRGFLVGLGHDGVGFLDRKTKKLTWVLGGLYDSFNLTMPQHPLFNHTPSLDEKKGELTLFSNRSWGLVGKSPPRILRYKLDLENKKMIWMKNLRRSEGEEFVHIMGSVQVTGEFLSIGYGSNKFTKYDFIEMHEDGKESWKFALDPERLVYRFYREPFGE